MTGFLRRGGTAAGGANELGGFVLVNPAATVGSTRAAAGPRVIQCPACLTHGHCTCLHPTGLEHFQGAIIGLHATSLLGFARLLFPQHWLLLSPVAGCHKSNCERVYESARCETARVLHEPARALARHVCPGAALLAGTGQGAQAGPRRRGAASARAPAAALPLRVGPAHIGATLHSIYAGDCATARARRTTIENAPSLLPGPAWGATNLT
jgi:hypothetical protein